MYLPIYSTIKCFVVIYLNSFWRAKMRVHLFGYYFNDILARVSLKEELLQVATSAKQQCQSHLPCYSKLES